MNRRLEDGIYDDDYGALETDFVQIITNCMTYNAQGGAAFPGGGWRAEEGTTE